MDFSTANIGLVLVGTFAFATNQGPGKSNLVGVVHSNIQD